MMKPSAIAFLIFFFCGNTVWAASPVGKIAYVDGAGLAEKVQDKKAGKSDFHLVDLRTEAEFAKGSIEGAINIPGKKLSFRAGNELAPSKEVVLCGYSASDPIAINAAIWLTNWGYSNIMILQGGWESWQKTTQEKEK